MTYRDQIRRTLAALRWQIVEVHDDGDWWLDEAWILQSTGAAFGASLHVTFVVDPQWQGSRKAGQGVWCVRASTGPLKDWNDTSTEVASICMAKRRFEDKLLEFRDDVSAFARSAG
ncbi:MAG: hypothetical protein AAF581_10325 [Planctomycetota bacterium]